VAISARNLLPRINRYSQERNKHVQQRTKSRVFPDQAQLILVVVPDGLVGSEVLQRPASPDSNLGNKISPGIGNI
jgi:hypothetical protein